MKTLTCEKALAEVISSAESVRNDESATVGTVSIGDVIRQGDLYVVAILELPEKRTPTTQRQLAPGTSQGSRHVLVGACEIYEADKGQAISMILQALAPAKIELHEALIGPVFRTLGEVALDHPEHGNRVLPSGECFAVVFQRQFGEEVRRVQD